MAESKIKELESTEERAKRVEAENGSLREENARLQEDLRSITEKLEKAQGKKTIDSRRKKRMVSNYFSVEGTRDSGLWPAMPSIQGLRQHW